MWPSRSRTVLPTDGAAHTMPVSVWQQRAWEPKAAGVGTLGFGGGTLALNELGPLPG